MDADVIAAAVERLLAGGVVAFPTDTVYGLGASASDIAAVDRIFAMKGRPKDRALIILVATSYAMQSFAKDIPPYAHALADAFWPGPLTLVLPRKSSVPDEVTGGHDTVGIRVPNHPVALELLRRLAERSGASTGLATPSANRFGEPPPTRAEEVIANFGPPGSHAEAPDIVIDGGECPTQIPSTIVRCVGPWPRLLRRGSISPEEIEAVIGRYVDR